jgi:tRNA(fMet)-specific endonuclease VapC
VKGFVLDTNHLGHAVRRSSSVRQRLEKARREGIVFGTCVPVLCELEAGVQQVHRPEDYRENLKRLLLQVRVWPIDLETARLYGEIHQRLRSQGRVLSTVDKIVAALAKQMKVKVLTTDRDFEALPEVRRENWVVS